MSENEKYTKELEELRKDINKIDDQIIDLLNKRGDIALKIGNNKIENSYKKEVHN